MMAFSQVKVLAALEQTGLPLTPLETKESKDGCAELTWQWKNNSLSFGRSTSYSKWWFSASHVCLLEGTLNVPFDASHFSWDMLMKLFVIIKILCFSRWSCKEKNDDDKFFAQLDIKFVFEKTIFWSLNLRGSYGPPFPDPQVVSRFCGACGRRRWRLWKMFCHFSY